MPHEPMDMDQRYTVAGLLRANTDKTPDRTMLVDRAKSWTWTEHHARACRVAHALRADGTRPGGRGRFPGSKRLPLLRDPVRWIARRDRERRGQLEALATGDGRGHRRLARRGARGHTAITCRACRRSRAAFPM